MVDQNEYLTPDFDPATLTVPRLRSILVQHDVSYPSSAKKSQLVDIFNDSVKPQARRILKSQASVRRSARGIEDVPSSRETSVTQTEEEEEPEPVTSPRRTARRSARQSTFDSLHDGAEEETPRVARTSRQASTRPSAQPVETVESHVTPRSPTRRTRQSIATPAIKVEDHDDDRRHDSGSPFSSANPFQSGSPQYNTPTTVNGASRRRTLGPVSAKSETRTSSSRRRTEGPTRNTSSNLDLTDGTLVSRKRYPAEHEAEPEDEEVEAGEEFTPEAQHELEVEARQEGHALVRPPKRRRVAGPANPVLKVAPWAISLAMLAGFGYVWREEKVAVGFCGVEQSSSSLGRVHIPDWAEFLQPHCEPCPPHAYCYSNLEVSCEPGFIMQPHPLSIGGLVPLPPTCEADGEKARRVKTVADHAVEELRERNAKWECGELKNEQGKRARSPEIQEPVLKKVFENRRKRSMSQEEFEELWAAAIDDIVQRDEIQHSVDGQTSARILRSISLAHVGLGCAIRRSVRVTLERYIQQLVLLILLVASALYGRYAITDARTTEARAKQLAGVTLERLASQAAWARHEGGDAENFISVAQLRDDVLRDEFSSKRRQQLWQKVQMKVEGNSNIRSMVREGRSGEVGRVWEWIGSLGAIESPRRDTKSIEGGSAVKEEIKESLVRAGASPREGWNGARPQY